MKKLPIDVDALFREHFACGIEFGFVVIAGLLGFSLVAGLAIGLLFALYAFVRIMLL